MIFNRDKKNSEQTTKSVEDSAINRWRTINNSENASQKSSNKDEFVQDMGFSKREGFLNSLMKDGLKSLSNSQQKQNTEEAISLTEEVDYDQEYDETDEYSEENDEYYEEDDSDDMSNEEEFEDSEESEFEEEYEETEEDVEVQADKSHNIALALTAHDPAPITVKEEQPKKEVKPKTPSADFSLNIEDDLKNRFGTNLKSALGEGTMIDGTFSFETPVKVDGCLTGEIRSKSALIVGKNARINARVKVGSLIVLGSVEGEIEVEDLIEVRSSGTLLGDVVTKRLALEEGGLFSGSCTMID